MAAAHLIGLVVLDGGTNTAAFRAGVLQAQIPGLWDWPSWRQGPMSTQHVVRTRRLTPGFTYRPLNRIPPTLPAGAGPAAGAPSPPPTPPKAAPPAAAATPSSSGASFPPHDVLAMPALSPTMAQGNILEWRKKVGDEVAAGDVLCEVETDKATISWESQEEGYVAAILLPGGSKDVPIGTPAAVLVEDKSLVAAFANFTAADASGASAAAAPAPSTPPPPKPAAAPKPAPSAAPAAPSTPPPRVAAPAAAGGRVVASPYARKLALESGVSLGGVAGSGPGGRITGADVQQLIASGGAAPAAAGAAAPAAAAAFAGAGGEWTDEAVSQVKRITAARLLESKQTIPHYYLTMECQVDALLALRAQVNKQLGEAGVKLSVNDFIVKAAALALRKVRAWDVGEPSVHQVHRRQERVQGGCGVAARTAALVQTRINI